MYIEYTGKRLGSFSLNSRARPGLKYIVYHSEPFTISPGDEWILGMRGYDEVIPVTPYVVKPRIAIVPIGIPSPTSRPVIVGRVIGDSTGEFIHYSLGALGELVGMTPVQVSSMFDLGYDESMKLLARARGARDEALRHMLQNRQKRMVCMET